MEAMQGMKEVLEYMERKEEKNKIIEAWSDNGRTEDVEKISDIEERIKVYSKWKELCQESTELKRGDDKKFVDFLEVAVKSMKVINKFSDFMENDDIENARNMVEEMQAARNELAAAAIKFLGL